MKILAKGLAFALTAVSALAAATEPSKSAVRLCGALVTSEVFTDAEELAAKKKALDDWKAKVQPLGEGYTNWVTAADKMIACVPSMSGGYECVARGHPCIIEQAPDRKHLRDKRIEM